MPFCPRGGKSAAPKGAKPAAKAAEKPKSFKRKAGWAKPKRK